MKNIVILVDIFLKEVPDKKMRLLNGDTNNRITMEQFLNNNLDIDNKQIWINILNRMIKLTPRERELVKIN